MYKIHKWDKGLNENGQLKTWSHKIKDILQEYNLIKTYVTSNDSPSSL